MVMSKTTKILLVLSISLLSAGLVFVTGVVTVGDAVALYAALPAGAILFGLFLIALSLQSETALFDEEQRRKIGAISSARPAVQKPCCGANAAEEKTVRAVHAH